MPMGKLCCKTITRSKKDSVVMKQTCVRNFNGGIPVLSAPLKAFTWSIPKCCAVFHHHPNRLFFSERKMNKGNWCNFETNRYTPSNVYYPSRRPFYFPIASRVIRTNGLIFHLTMRSTCLNYQMARISWKSELRMTALLFQK